MSIRYCPGCLEKQQRINALEEKVASLEGKLRYQQRTAKEGAFGSSTPSSKVPVKANSLAERQARRGGAPRGHPGHGRRAFSESEADRVQTVPLPDRCPSCGTALEAQDTDSRTVMDGEPMKVHKIVYRLPRKRCPRCKRFLRARAPGVLPKSLWGNGLLTHVVIQHYLRGVTLGSLAQQTGMAKGSLVAALHRVARHFKDVPQRLAQEYRHAPVKHADETIWRTDGQNGYAWEFCAPQITVLSLRKTRAASVAKEVLGDQPLPGVLVSDRYSAYNKAPCSLQYCYAHLLRDVQDLEKKFPDAPEVHRFVQSLAPLLAEAMRLRTLPLSHRQFKRRAVRLKRKIIQINDQPARHPGVQSVQDIFRQYPHRLYHWTQNRNIPADNNFAERELRPLVIARKISFGSQSDAGAKTREILMSIVRTLHKRTPDVNTAFRSVLDQLAQHPALDPFALLFPPDTS